MSHVWLVAGAVTLATHGALAGWLAQREPAPHPPLPKTVVRLKVASPPPVEAVTPPKPPEPPPPPPPPPRLVKRLRPKATPSQPPPDGPTRTDIVEPAESGLSPDQSALQGTMTVQGGGGIDGAIQDGKGREKTRVAEPPAPRPPARRFVPIFEVTRMPKAIRPVQPEVPDEFRSQNREAVVVVEVAISAAGRVVEARVIKKAGFGLDEAAIAAARRTTFEPAMQGDRPVAVKMQIPYRFKVRG
ncbi:MAG TPA: TonB family protein [Kofleriaceae bacterium]|nr:TonB family protein [Kofleriaceae bacterium]